MDPSLGNRIKFSEIALRGFARWTHWPVRRGRAEGALWGVARQAVTDPSQEIFCQRDHQQREQELVGFYGSAPSRPQGSGSFLNVLILISPVRRVSEKDEITSRSFSH